MKTKLLLLVFSLISVMLYSQDYVSTEPQNKNAIIEEFTGVRCGYCPQGHQILHDILETYPDQAFAVGYHPSNSSFCVPHNSTDPDFRRDFPNAFFNTSYCGTNPFMPGAFVQRKKWTSNERLRSRGSWMSHTQQVIAEPSPLNVGLTSSYDIFNDEIQITAEFYFTETVENDLTFYVLMSENGLVAQQSSGGTNYVHYHVFREAFTNQWGNPIANTNTGDYKKFQYTFNNDETGYNLMSCELIAFVYDTDNEVVISGIGADVGESTYVKPEAGFSGQDTIVPIEESVKFIDESSFAPTDFEWFFEGGDPETSNERNPEVTYNEPGIYDVQLIVENPAGSDTLLREDYIEVYDPVGIRNAEMPEINIYPNPSNDVVNIKLNTLNDIKDIVIFNISGEEIVRIVPESLNTAVDLIDYSKGVYFVQMNTQLGVETEKLIIK